MTQDTIEFPAIDAEAAEKTQIAITAAAGALDLTKFNLADVALAQFGKWEDKAASTRKTLTGVVHDFSTQTKLDEGKSLRQRLINAPRTEARKVSKALKSELNTVSGKVGAKLAEIEAEYESLEQLITPQIELREAALEAERAEKVRIEAARKDAHEANLAVLAGYVEKAKGLPSERIAAGIATVEAIVIDRAAWEEFADRAEEQRSVTIERLRALHAEVLAAEVAAAEAEARRVELARVAAEQAAEARRLKEAADALAMHEERQAAERAEFERERAAFAAQQEAARKAAEAAAAPVEAPAPEPVVTAEVEPEAPAPAPAVALVMPNVYRTSVALQTPPPAEPGKVITTGAVCDWLGFSITGAVDFLRSMGFEPAPSTGRGVYWNESDLSAIRDALIVRLANLKAPQ